MGLIKPYFRYLQQNRHDIANLQILILIRPFLGSIGFMMIVPMLAFMNIGEAPTDPITKTLSQWLPIDSLWHLLTMFFLLSLVTAYINYRHSLISSEIVNNILRSLRNDLYQRLMSTDWQQLTGLQQADYTRIMVDELDTISTVLEEAIYMVSQLFVVTVYIGLCFIVSPSLTITALLIGAGLFAANIPLQKAIAKQGERTMTVSEHLYRLVNQQIRGVKSIKASATESRQIRRFNLTTDRVKEVTQRATQLTSLSQLLYSMLAALGLSVVLYVASEVLVIETQALILIAVIFSRLLPKLNDLYFPFQNYLYLRPSLKSVNALMDLCHEHQEVTTLDTRFDPLQPIKLQNVDYHYPANDSAPVLSNLCISIAPRQIVAIKGASGIGKTTLLDLLSGLTSPTAGKVMVGSEELKESNRKTWRDNLFYVTQEPFLVSATVKDNLTLLLNDVPGDDAIRMALHKADADFVESLPEGIHSVIADDGISLSAGQRQRLLLARAFLSRKPVLILDETTSNLDSQSESKIVEHLREISDSTTIILVSHRTSVHAICDQVIDIDEFTQSFRQA